MNVENRECGDCVSQLPCFEQCHCMMRIRSALFPCPAASVFILITVAICELNLCVLLWVWVMAMAATLCTFMQVEQKSQEHDLIINEFERVKQHNMRLEITCKDYQEKLLASEAIMANYKAIQEENRRLYNQVQDLRGNIRVFCR